MDKPRWLFNELEHAGSEHLTTAQVVQYDRKASFDPSRELQYLEAYGLSAADTFVDLGAGTGTLALEVAKRCRRVVAVDISPAMLEVIQLKAEEAKLNNVEIVHAGFLTYKHEGERADVVYSRNALHHLPDFWKVQALLRVTRLLKPSGIFRLRDLAYSFDPQGSDERIEAWLAGAPKSATEGVPRHELEAHVRDEYSTYTWLLEAMLERAGFEIKAAAYSASGVFADYACALRSEQVPTSEQQTTL